MKHASHKYSEEPRDGINFTEKFDKFYTQSARIYDVLVKWLPMWSNWLKQTLPYMQGPRVLEISFGTGYLLAQYADQFQVYGIDYNRAMAQTAKRNLLRKGLKAELQQADVNCLPYTANSFDTIVNTMAFSGYADGKQALNEMKRVLKGNGKLLMIDINYPRKPNWFGNKLTQFWMASGDIIRDMDELFKSSGWEYEDKEIGAGESVHLYIARKTKHEQ